jgi:uncharacterized protein YbjT (DUF2867 family)
VKPVEVAAVAILVTGAGGLLGQAAVKALLGQGVEHVRAVVGDQAQAQALRRAGAKVAVIEPADSDLLEAVLDGVFTAVGLAGGPWIARGQDPAGAVLAPWRALVEAAGRAGVTRLVLVVPAAADPGSPNPYLAACGQAERLAAASGLEHVVLRVSHVVAGSAPLVRRLRATVPVPVPGSGHQRCVPLLARDLARAIAAADDHQALDATLELAGPELYTFDQLVDLVRGATCAKVHGAGAPWTPAQADWLARDALVGDGGWATLGLGPSPLGLDLATAPGGPLGAGRTP